MKDWNEIARDPALIANYSLVQKIGLLDYVDHLHREQKSLETLLGAALEIFAMDEVGEIIDYTVRILSERLIPQTLAFVLKSGPGRGLLIKGFENLKEIDPGLALSSLKPYEDFFAAYPGAIAWSLFEYQIGEAAAALAPARPEMVVPVRGVSGLNGLILIGPKVIEGQYSGSEIALIDRLMRFASIAIQNNLHYERSVRDAKTGLYNHGHFVARLREELKRSVRSGKPLGLLVMDLDHFKLFNDQYGHLAGDAVLQAVARALQAGVRGSDLTARFGGEEFVALLPETGEEGAFLVAERIRQSVEELAVPWEGQRLKVTISLGVYALESCTNETEDDLISRADEALYRSKRDGRNRSSLYRAGLLARSRALRAILRK